MININNKRKLFYKYYFFYYKKKFLMMIYFYCFFLYKLFCRIFFKYFIINNIDLNYIKFLI